MTRSNAALHGIRILSLALNLPGPAALMRCRRMGATCTKIEPPSGDPMGLYNPGAHAELHEGVKVLQADLKTHAGQELLQRELARTDVLLTSFRPSALEKLGLSWARLHGRYPSLSQVAIVGSGGARAEEPGHDLTYLAAHGLEPHFAARLCEAAGVQAGDVRTMFRQETQAAIAAFFAGRTRAELESLAVEKDLPIHTMA